MLFKKSKNMYEKSFASEMEVNNLLAEVRQKLGVKTLSYTREDLEDAFYALSKVNGGDLNHLVHEVLHPRFRRASLEKKLVYIGRVDHDAVVDELAKAIKASS